MKYLGPTSRPRLNEAVAVVFLFAGLFLLISLVSYNPLDPSWNTATAAPKPFNLMGRAGRDSGGLPAAGIRIRGLRDPGSDSAAGLELGAFRAHPHTLGQACRGGIAGGCLLRRLRVRHGLASDCRLAARRRRRRRHSGRRPGCVHEPDRRGHVHRRVLDSGTLSGVDFRDVEAGEMVRRAGVVLWTELRARCSAECSGDPRRLAKMARSARAHAPRSVQRRRVLQTSHGGKSRSAAAAAAEPRSPRMRPIQPSINDPQRPPFVPQSRRRERRSRMRNMEEIPIRTLEELPPEPRRSSWRRRNQWIFRGARAPKPVQSEPRKRALFVQTAAHQPAAGAAGAHRFRQPGVEGNRRQHQVQVRGVQRSRNRYADQPRTGGHHLRVQARSRREVFAHHYAHRGPVPGPAGRIDSDRTHSRQADRRH